MHPINGGYEHSVCAGPAASDCRYLLAEVQRRHMQVNVNVRRMRIVTPMKKLEFFVCQPDSPRPCSPSRLLEVGDQVDN
jgi:hypothetical protein